MTTSARTWLADFAAALGTPPPTDAEMDELLSLAAVAAHASERVAAPVACWLTARAGRTPAEALDAARGLEAAGDAPGSGSEP